MAAADRRPDLVVRGTVVTPDRVIADGAVVVRGGVVDAVVEGREAASAASAAVSVGGGDGMLVLPGAVDAHVHAFSDPGETFVGATRAAAAGGVTTIIDMPYDAGAPVNTAEAVRAKRERIAAEAVVDVALHGTVRPLGGVADVQGIIDEGVCGFKVSLFETDPVRFPRVPSDELVEALRIASRSGVRMGVHAEDGEIIRALIARSIAHGRTRPIDHVRSRPPVSETASVALGLDLAASVGGPFHIFHASLPSSADLVEARREAGLPFTAETCPHYLVLDEADMDRLGARGKINPPLRSAEDAEGMWEALADGRIDMVTSDHAPWSLEKKSFPMIFDNASGAPGVQTLLPLVIGEGYFGGRLSLLRAVRVLSGAPAEAFSVDHRKGALVPGRDADIALVDPAARTRFADETMYSTATWTPYDDRTVRGRVSASYVRGTAVYRDGDGVLADAGDGRFVARAA